MTEILKIKAREGMLYSIPFWAVMFLICLIGMFVGICMEPDDNGQEDEEKYKKGS